MDSIRQQILGPMREPVEGSTLDDALREQVRKISVECNLPETDDNADLGELFHLGREMCAAVANLLRGRLIAWRGAANYGCNPCFAETKPIVFGHTVRLVCKACIVEDGVHEIAGSVTRKWSSGSVCTMSSGSKSENKHTGSRISEAGDRTSPVRLVAIGFSLRLADALAVDSQTHTTLAGGDGLLNFSQNWREGPYGGASHYTHDSGRL